MRKGCCAGIDFDSDFEPGVDIGTTLLRNPKVELNAKDAGHLWAGNTVLRSDLKKRILVQNDAKLMPNVVQGGREVPRFAGLPAHLFLDGGSQPGGASEANAYGGEYWRMSRA